MARNLIRRTLLLSGLSIVGGSLFALWFGPELLLPGKGNTALGATLGVIVLFTCRWGYALAMKEPTASLDVSFPLGRSPALRLTETLTDLIGLPGQESTILRAMAHALGFEHAGLYRREASGGRWHWVADTFSPKPRSALVLYGSPLTGGMPLLTDYDQIMPLNGRTGLVGMLALKNPNRHHPLTAARRRALSQIGEMLALNLENQWLGRELLDEEIATRKALEDKALHDRVNAVVSHQLKTPLLLGQALLSDALVSLDNRARVGKRLEKIAASLTRFERNVMQNFDRQGIDPSRFRLSLEAVSLPVAVGRSLDEARYMLGKRQIEVQVEVPSHLAVIADPPRLEVVFDNLISNALKAMEPGGRLTLRASSDGRNVWLDLSDTGGGIPPERLAGLFRVQPPNPDDPTSTGVGLSITREYLEAMGGGISLLRNTPRGATFRLRLKVAHTNAAPARGAARKPH